MTQFTRDELIDLHKALGIALRHTTDDAQNKFVFELGWRVYEEWLKAHQLEFAPKPEEPVTLTYAGYNDVWNAQLGIWEYNPKKAALARKATR